MVRLNERWWGLRACARQIAVADPADTRNVALFSDMGVDLKAPSVAVSAAAARSFSQENVLQAILAVDLLPDLAEARLCQLAQGRVCCLESPTTNRRASFVSAQLIAAVSASNA